MFLSVWQVLSGKSAAQVGQSILFALRTTANLFAVFQWFGAKPGMNNQDWSEYLWSKSTGQAMGGVYGQLGAEHARKPVAPQQPTKVHGATQGQVYVPDPAPVAKPLTPEQKAERARRNRNINRIGAQPSIWNRMLGRTYSYLSEDGAFNVDKDGELLEGKLVSQTEHFERLKSKYREFWMARYQFFKALHDSEDVEDAEVIWRDARERLRLLDLNTLVSPMDEKGLDISLSLLRTKNGLIKKKKVKSKVWKVSPSEYDKRLRLFVSKAYRHQGAGALNVSDQPLRQRSAEEVIKWFISLPR